MESLVEVYLWFECFVFSETPPIIQSSVIKVANNYVYDDPKLWTNKTFQRLVEITNQLGNVISSHEIVSFWMIQANKACAAYLSQRKIGIYRMVKTKMNATEIDIPACAIREQSVQNWVSSSGQYTLMDPDDPQGSGTLHPFLKTNFYVQVTSPIRRLVDLVNQMILFQEMGCMIISEDAKEFITKWCMKLDYLNATMRSIRKIQVDCELLHKFTKHGELLEQAYNGIVFDRFERQTGIYSYMVYLEKLKLLCRTNSLHFLENNTLHLFRVYLFENEECTKKKIRVARIE